MKGIHLPGLEGTNPLSFLAALGVQVAFASEDRQPQLWWSEDITPHVIVDAEFSVDQITNRALEMFANWKDSMAVNPQRTDGSRIPQGDALKLTPDDIRIYLQQAGQCCWSDGLATALLAEGSLDNNNVAKPSDFYFTAGKQIFLDTARKILAVAKHEDIETILRGPWRYESEDPSLGWDVSDDRVYALRARNPAEDRKKTNPGAEALAILGLSLYPVFAGRDRTLTQGCSGSWKAGNYSWPLWRRPASPCAVKSLLAHAYDHPAAANRQRWYRSWGISTILRSSIRRSGQGGYGTFGPAAVVWKAG